MKSYVVVITSGHVRDVQISNKPDPDPMDDSWVDWMEAEIFLGIFPALTPEDAIKAAANREDLPESALRAISV